MIYSADGSAVIDAHLTDENAHKDEFAKYLPLSGGEMTGAIVVPKSSAAFLTPDKAAGMKLYSEQTSISNYDSSDASRTELRLFANGSFCLDGSKSGYGISSFRVFCGSDAKNSRGEALKGVYFDSEREGFWSGNRLAEQSYVDSTVKAAQPVAHLVTLASSGWNSSAKTQTVSCADVVADETAQQILPMPAAASMSAYNDAGILCTGQGAGTLTFTADTVPTADLQVYVTITPVRFS